jgi:hypothetical protein
MMDRLEHPGDGTAFTSLFSSLKRKGQFRTGLLMSCTNCNECVFFG